MSFFSSDYFEARARFRTTTEKAGAKLHSLKLRATGPRGEDLTIDLAVLGNPRAPKVMLHSSGIHGVEGFAGSAIQLALLSQPPEVPTGTSVVLAHILNPFGMAWLRRTNEHNVDLNRNFIPSGEPYSDENEKYQFVNDFLNPKDRLGGFWSGGAFNLLRFGFETFKKTVTQGQYTYPNGLFYGGQRPQESVVLYSSWLKDNIGPIQNLIALDVHSGLGRFGKEVLFCHAEGEGPDIGKTITATSGGVGYKVRGGLETLTRELAGGKTWAHFTQEFGTFPMAQVLKNLRAENFYFHQKRESGPAQLLLRDTLTPLSEDWRQSVIELGTDTFKRILSWLGRAQPN
jgi:hypothetical protein